MLIFCVPIFYTNRITLGYITILLYTFGYITEHISEGARRGEIGRKRGSVRVMYTCQKCSDFRTDPVQKGHDHTGYTCACKRPPILKSFPAPTCNARHTDMEI